MRTISFIGQTIQPPPETNVTTNVTYQTSKDASVLADKISVLEKNDFTTAQHSFLDQWDLQRVGASTPVDAVKCLETGVHGFQ